MCPWEEPSCPCPCSVPGGCKLLRLGHGVAIPHQATASPPAAAAHYLVVHVCLLKVQEVPLRRSAALVAGPAKLVQSRREHARQSECRVPPALLTAKPFAAPCVQRLRADLQASGPCVRGACPGCCWACQNGAVCCCSSFRRAKRCRAHFLPAWHLHAVLLGLPNPCIHSRTQMAEHHLHSASSPCCWPCQICSAAPQLPGAPSS